MEGKKYFGLAFIAVLVLSFIFISTQIPAAHQSIKNLPIALVNEDTGQMGQTLIDTIQENAKAMKTNDEPMMKFDVLENEQQMKEEMTDQNFYGAIVIPSDFTEKYMSLQTATPTSPELQLYVNQGKNVNVANVVSQTLSGIVAKMNEMMSNQLLSAMEQNNVPLNVEQARIYTSPILSSTIMLNETGKLGNAPLSLFQPLWIASIASAVLLTLAGRKNSFKSISDHFKFKSIQLLIAIVLGFVVGFALTWYTTFMLDFEYESFLTVAFFLSITCISFILLISAALSWIGLGGVALFVLLMFFGLPLLQLAPEMLPEFYKDWIYPWLPMRFMFDGLRDILFFNGEIWNSATTILIWVAIVSAIVHLTKSRVLKKNVVEEVQEEI